MQRQCSPCANSARAKRRAGLHRASLPSHVRQGPPGLRVRSAIAGGTRTTTNAMPSAPRLSDEGKQMIGIEWGI